MSDDLNPCPSCSAPSGDECPAWCKAETGDTDGHPCAVHVCDNTHHHGEGGVCDKCETHAFDSTNKCPSCDVVMCDGCGKRPAWAVIGGEGSPLWSCESCMNDLLSIPVQERDIQAAVHPCEECAEVSEPSTLDHLRDALGKIDTEKAALLLGLDEDEATPADLDAWADNLHDMTGEGRFDEVASLLLSVLEGWAE